MGLRASKRVVIFSENAAGTTTTFTRDDVYYINSGEVPTGPYVRGSAEFRNGGSAPCDFSVFGKVSANGDEQELLAATTVGAGATDNTSWQDQDIEAYDYIYFKHNGTGDDGPQIVDALFK